MTQVQVAKSPHLPTKLHAVGDPTLGYVSNRDPATGGFTSAKCNFLKDKINR